MVDCLGGRLLHLVAREVDEQVGDAEHRVVGILAHADLDGGAVFLAHHAVQRQRGGDPVVGLDAAVVVRVQVGHVAGLVERVLLEVEARRVDVRAEDAQAVLERGGADVDEHEGLVVAGGVDLVAGLEGAACGTGRVERDVARLLGELDAGGDALALGLVLGDEGAVVAAELLELGDGRFVVGLPGVRTFHRDPFSCGQFRTPWYHGAHRSAATGRGEEIRQLPPAAARLIARAPRPTAGGGRMRSGARAPFPEEPVRRAARVPATERLYWCA